ALIVEELTSRRARTISVPEVAYFWIKLRGVLVDLPEHLQATASLFESITSDQMAAYRQASPQYCESVERALAVRQRALDVRAALSRDEHIYAEWSRNREAHIKQRAYTLQPKNKLRELKDAFEVSSLGERIGVDEQWEAIRRVMRQCGGNDRRVAIALARKLR